MLTGGTAWEETPVADVSTRLAAALADRYAVERELGAGGMATVCLAEDLKHHRKVALKVLRPGHCLGPTGRRVEGGGGSPGGGTVTQIE